MAFIGVWVGSLPNQLFHYMIRMRVFFLYAALSDSVYQFHILSTALLIVAFSIDTVSLLAKILWVASKNMHRYKTAHFKLA